MTRWLPLAITLAIAAPAGALFNAEVAINSAEAGPCKSRWYISAESKNQSRDLEALHSALARDAASVTAIDRTHITYELREPLGLVGALLLTIDEREFTISTRITRTCEKWDGGYAHRPDFLSRAEETSIRDEMNKLADHLRSTPELSGLKFQVRSKN